MTSKLTIVGLWCMNIFLPTLMAILGKFTVAFSHYNTKTVEESASIWDCVFRKPIYAPKPHSWQNFSSLTYTDTLVNNHRNVIRCWEFAL